jgi:hypothetical protein
MRYVVILLFSWIWATCVVAQSVLKLRTGAGYYVGFSSPTRDAIGYAHMFGADGNIYFHSQTQFALYDNITYPFLLEYEHNQNWSFQSGVVLNGRAYTNTTTFVPMAGSYDPETGLIPMGTALIDMSLGGPLVKTPFTFSVKVLRFGSSKARMESNEKAFFMQLNLLAGGGYQYLRFWKSLDRQLINVRAINDGLGNTYQFEYEWRSRYAHSGFLSVGLGFQFRTRRNEFATLNIVYEQGLREVYAVKMDYYRFASDGNVYSHTGPYVGTRGSNLSFNLTFPIFTYNFTKKKFYRD